jgi:hypothetical protein
LDLPEITLAATRMGPEIAELWHALRARADSEVQRRGGE